MAEYTYKMIHSSVPGMEVTPEGELIMSDEIAWESGYQEGWDQGAKTIAELREIITRLEKQNAELKANANWYWDDNCGMKND